MHRFMLYAINFNSAWVVPPFFAEPHNFPCLEGKKKRAWTNFSEKGIILKRKDFKVNIYSPALGQEIACDESTLKRGLSQKG